MTIEDLSNFLDEHGYAVEQITGADNKPYLVIRAYTIAAGSLAGRTCDIAIQCLGSVPFVMPPAIHTRPALLAMGKANTQRSSIGPEWQYWSRVLRANPAPRIILAHLATIFSEV